MMWASVIPVRFGHRGGRYLAFREVMFHAEEVDALRRANSMDDAIAMAIEQGETLDAAYERRSLLG